MASASGPLCEGGPSHPLPLPAKPPLIGHNCGSIYRVVMRVTIDWSRKHSVQHLCRATGARPSSQPGENTIVCGRRSPVRTSRSRIIRFVVSLPTLTAGSYVKTRSPVRNRRLSGRYWPGLQSGPLRPAAGRQHRRTGRSAWRSISAATISCQRGLAGPACPSQCRCFPPP